MRIALFAAACAAFATMTPVQAQGEESLARERGCLSCHDVSQYKIAPSFKAVSLKFRGNEEQARSRFVSALRDGVGHPKSTMTEEEIARITRWILSL